MDTFFEQIVSVRKSGKAIAAITGIWLLALLLSVLLFLFPFLGSLNILLICGILFGAFKLCGKFNLEYEYIITNGTMDIDRIINKSSRKRELSLELSTVSRIEKFNAGLLNSINRQSLTVACDENAADAYLLVAEREGKGSAYLVFEPDERLKGAIVKFVPKFVANSAFKS
ncbi:MAG: hypothetical protein IKD04_03935 [Clostridia bacterium]|nr:hypothetical protein [Clostridia bacterium]